jgi:hypothetical protein
MLRIKKRRIYKILLLVLFYIFGPLFLAYTNPQQLPLPLILVPFIWLFVAIFIAVNGLIKWRFSDLVHKRRTVIAGVCAALPVLLVVFESIHQLTIKDILIVVALVAITSFYILRADFLK